MKPAGKSGEFVRKTEDTFNRAVGPVNDLPTIQLPPRDILCGLPTVAHLGTDKEAVWSPPVMRVVGHHMPTRATPGSAGHDLVSIQPVTIPKNGSATVNTGCAIELPSGHYGKIEGRSSLAVNHDVVAFGGVIDEDYRGMIHVKLFNHGKRSYRIKAGERIAQLIVQRYAAPRIECVGTISQTQRGTGGFGSTGK